MNSTRRRLLSHPCTSLLTTMCFWAAALPAHAAPPAAAPAAPAAAIPTVSAVSALPGMPPVAPGHGTAHQQRCLEALALW